MSDYIEPSEDARELHEKRSTYTPKGDAIAWLAQMREALVEKDK